MAGHRPGPHLSAQPGPLWVVTSLQSVAAKGPARPQAMRPEANPDWPRGNPGPSSPCCSSPAPDALPRLTWGPSPAQAVRCICTCSEPCLQALKDECHAQGPCPPHCSRQRHRVLSSPSPASSALFSKFTCPGWHKPPLPPQGLHGSSAEPRLGLLRSAPTYQAPHCSPCPYSQSNPKPQGLPGPAAGPRTFT